MREIWHLCHVRLFVLILNFPRRDVRLKSPVEVTGTHAGIDNGQYDKDNSDYGESRQRPSDWDIYQLMGRFVHAYKFEEKVRHSRQEQDLERVGND